MVEVDNNTCKKCNAEVTDVSVLNAAQV